MASRNGHVPDREEGRRQDMTPAPVEAVIGVGYPAALVRSVYQRLLPGSPRADPLSEKADAAAAMTGNAPPRDVSAPALMLAVDDAIRHGSVGASGGAGGLFVSGGPTPSGSGLETSYPGSAAGHDEGRRASGGEDGMEVSTDDGDDGGVSSSASQGRSGPLPRPPSAGRVALESAPSGTDGQPSTANRPSSTSQSFARNRRSASNQRSADDQSSIDANAEIADPSSGTSSVAASSGRNPTPREAASSLTASSSAPETAGRQDGHAETSASSSSASSSKALTASSRPKASSESAVMNSSSASATADGEPHASANPKPEVTGASRDRSRERKEEQGASPTAEDKARERRRQLNRLRALREENRRLKARKTCLRCRRNEVALTLLPCGHFCLCEGCGPSQDECPVCGKTVLADVKTFVT